MTTSSSDFSLMNAALSLPISFISLLSWNPNSNLHRILPTGINTGPVQHGLLLGSLKWRTTYPSSKGEENSDGFLELSSYTTDPTDPNLLLLRFEHTDLRAPPN
jgi:hypothetical protein